MVNEQAAIRAVLPRGTAKWVARLMNIEVRTARHWVEQSVPAYRREEFGLRLLDAYYRKREDDDRDVLPAILHMAGLGNEVYSTLKGCGIASNAATLVFAAQRRVEAKIARLEADQKKNDK